MSLPLEIGLPVDLPARVTRRLRRLRARTRHRFGLPVRMPGDVDIARNFRHPIDASRRWSLVALYRRRFAASTQAELAEAARLVAHRFTIHGHAADHGERIAWSRDPVSGRDWPRGFSPDIPYRGAERLGDVKLPWELNKHQYFFTLGKADWLSGESGRAVEIVSQIDQWIADNPYQIGINWISGLEVGARAVSWVMAHPFYADVCDDEFRHRLAGSLAQHLLFVAQHLSIGQFANTHLVGESAALVAGGLFLACRESARWLETGMRTLEREIERQVRPDGLHAEQSVAYHRFCLDHYYLVQALLAANGQSFGPRTLARMEQMTEVLMHLVFPNGMPAAFGDADDARGMWMHADSLSDYRGLLALGAVTFGRPDFKDAAQGLHEEVLWLLGASGVTAFDELAARPPSEASTAFADAGYYVMRGGWAPSDPMLVADCGPHGLGRGAHAHADALSFQVHVSGYPFLVDPGAYSYNLDYAWRDAFRGTRAHNTVVVDACDQSIPGDRMSWQTAARSHVRRWTTTSRFDLIDADHDGYRRLADPVTHRRVILFLKPDVWVVFDDVTASARHHVEMLLHLRPDCGVDSSPTGDVVLRSPRGDRLHVGAAGELSTHPIEVVDGSETERGAWFSATYGVKAPSRMLRVAHEIDGSTWFATSLSTSERARPRVSRRGGWLEIEVGRDKARHETLWYRTAPTQARETGGIRFDGAILWLRRDAGAMTSVWAGDFEALSIAGRLDVRAPVPIQRLALDGNRCEILVDPSHASEVRATGPGGLSLVVNGRTAAPSANDAQVGRRG